jgi:hypothetical protein
MFDILKNLFPKAQPKESKKRVSMGDPIRKYVKNKYIIPARTKKAGRVVLVASDVDNGMGLGNKYAMVCSALDSNKFLEFARVELIRREGPAQGGAAKWTLKIKP